MKKNNRILWLCVMVIAGIVLNSSCERPIIVEQDDELSITDFIIDGQYCIEHLKADTLYRINNQNDMDILFETYSPPLPQLDFFNQSMFLIYGWCTGSVHNKDYSFVKLNDNEYHLDIDITDSPMLPAGIPWVVAFYTNKKIEESDSISVSVNIHE